MPLSTALKDHPERTVLLADTFNNLTGNMSPFMTMVSMYIVCFVLTQFVTNSAVNNAFKTLAALICVQNGFDARALMLSCQEGSSNCYLTPMGGAPAMTMAYEAGGYKMKVSENGLCALYHTVYPVCGVCAVCVSASVNLGKCSKNGYVPNDN